MDRVLRVGVRVLIVLTLLGSGGANGQPFNIERPDLSAAGPWSSTLRIEINDRIRGEFVDWFEAGPASNDRYDFWANRFQVGLRVTRDRLFDSSVNLQGFFQFQHSLIDDVPTSAPGPGGVYRANTNQRFQQESIFRQGWLSFAAELAGDKLTVMGGRTRFMDGAETVPEDPSLRWIKSTRVAQRLLGPFDYTHVGRSFDGIQAAYDHHMLNVTGFWHQPTSGGFEVDSNKNISQIDVAGVSITAANPEGFEPTDARLFWIYYDDHRDVARLDNRPLTERLADTDATTIHTIGGNAAHIFPLAVGKVDVLAWVAGQLGDWQSQSQRAWAYDFEAGYQPELPMDPWVRVGFFRSSGDPDPDDDTHETFFQMLPTARLYAKTPFYNMMNNQDLFVQLLLAPLKRLKAQTEFHWLSATESDDFVYFGGGATKKSFFGFGGVPAQGDREIGFLTDIGLTWTPVDILKFYAYYGHVFGQDVLRNNFADEDLNYGYVEMTVSF